MFCDNCDNHDCCKALNYKIGGNVIIPHVWYGLKAIEILTNKNIFGQVDFSDDMPNIVYESVIILQQYKLELDKKKE